MAILKRKDDVRRGLIAPSPRSQPRPAPDAAELAGDDEPGPQPERREPELHDPTLRDLSFADYKAIVQRACKEFMSDNCMMLASALAYSSFFAIPSVIIVAVGLFTLVASPQDITNVIQHLHGVIPGDAASLLGDSLKRTSQNTAGSIVMTLVGFVLAVWAVTGAMNSYMTALNLAYDRPSDRRSFVKKRVVALKMAGIMGVAFALVAVLTLFGPVVEQAIASRIGPAGDVLNVVWWIAQWPILLGGLLVAFAALLYLGPDVDHPKWEFLTPGSLTAALLWIAASGLFAVYTATFASYNKTWGSLSAVIVMLTWLWITALALLFGAELNAEIERGRELRKGEPAQEDIQAPHQAGAPA
jgi:membrane protein